MCIALIYLWLEKWHGQRQVDLLSKESKFKTVKLQELSALQKRIHSGREEQKQQRHLDLERFVGLSFFLSFFLSFSVCFLFPPLCFSYFLFSIFYFILVFLSIFLYCYFLSTLIRPSCLHLSSCCSIVCHSLISLFISSKTLFFLTPFWISIFMPPSLTSPFPLIITFPHAWTLLSPYFYDILFISHPSYSSH